MASPSELLTRLLENWPTKIIALGLALVIVLLNDLANVGERYFTVPLQLRLAEDVVPSVEHTNRVRVRIRGDESRIFDVLEEDIIALADFTQHTLEGIFRAPVQVVRTGTALDPDALEISVEPTSVIVTLEEKLVRSLEVVPNITGFPPPGYELSDYRVSPTTVDVVGPQSTVADLRQILTEEIRLTGRTSDFSERVRLSRPGMLVEFPGGSIVDFRALIVETVIQTMFDDLDISILDLHPELAVVSEMPAGTIRVQGKQLDVESVPQGRVGLFVDAGAITEPGTYSLPVRPQIPGGILVLGIDPSRVELTVDDAIQALDAQTRADNGETTGSGLQGDAEDLSPPTDEADLEGRESE